MKQLLTIEFIKLRKLKSLQIIFLIYAVISPVAIYTISKFITNFMTFFLPKDYSPFAFPDVWAVATYSASYFNILMGVLARSEEHTSELQSRPHLVCRLLLEKKNKHL